MVWMPDNLHNPQLLRKLIVLVAEYIDIAETRHIGRAATEII